MKNRFILGDQNYIIDTERKSGYKILLTQEVVDILNLLYNEYKKTRGD